MGVARQVVAELGWSLPYTLGVLGGWKLAPGYCRAVLSYDQRIALDGAEGAAPAVVKPKLAPPIEAPAQLRDRVRASLLRRSA